MIWGEKILRSLQGQKELENQLAFGFVPQRHPLLYTATCEVAGATLHVVVEDFDRFGVLLSGIQCELSASRLSGDSDDSFDRRIERLENEVCHLYGELRLIEKDVDARQAVLCTVPDANRFFEVKLRGDEVMLNHFTVHEETRKRTKTPANMSMESFVLLVDQLFELLGSHG
jgi:hypothetical protein